MHIALCKGWQFCHANHLQGAHSTIQNLSPSKQSAGVKKHNFWFYVIFNYVLFLMIFEDPFFFGQGPFPVWAPFGLGPILASKLKNHAKSIFWSPRSQDKIEEQETQLWHPKLRRPKNLRNDNFEARELQEWKVGRLGRSPFKFKTF